MKFEVQLLSGIGHGLSAQQPHVATLMAIRDTEYFHHHRTFCWMALSLEALQADTEQAETRPLNYRTRGAIARHPQPSTCQAVPNVLSVEGCEDGLALLLQYPQAVVEGTPALLVLHSSCLPWKSIPG